MKNKLFYTWDIIKTKNKSSIINIIPYRILVENNDNISNKKDSINNESIINKIVKLKTISTKFNLFLDKNLSTKELIYLTTLLSFIKQNIVYIYFTPDSINKEIIKLLLDMGIKRIVLPLDSVNPKTYNMLWKSKDNKFDSFEHIWQMIDLISYEYKDQIELFFSCTISRLNIHEIISTFGWCANFNHAKIKFRPIQPEISEMNLDWYNNQKYKIFWPTKIDELNNTLDYLSTKITEHKSICLNNSNDLLDMKTYFSDQKKWILNNRIAKKNIKFLDGSGKIF